MYLSLSVIAPFGTPVIGAIVPSSGDSACERARLRDRYGTGLPSEPTFDSIGAGKCGADDGNRTRVFSLGSRFAISACARGRPPRSDIRASKPSESCGIGLCGSVCVHGRPQRFGGQYSTSCDIRVTTNPVMLARHSNL